MRRIVHFLRKIPILGPLLVVNPVRVKACLPRWLFVKLYRPPLDQKKVDAEIKEYLKTKESGLGTPKRKPATIVSLTSYPARIPRIHYTIFSLLKQTVKPDEIILWLAEEQFPNGNADLPESLLQFRKHGLTIRYCHDIRSYKKLVPALKEFPDDVIVTVDDDAYYNENMLAAFVNSYEKNKHMIHGNRGAEITLNAQNEIEPYLSWNRDAAFQEAPPSHRIFFTGIGGILYPPHTLHADVLRENLFMTITPTADDVWFWAMAVLQDTKRCVVESKTPAFVPNEDFDYDTHFDVKGLLRVNQDNNDLQIAALVKHYPNIIERLKEN